jgi:phosphopantetheinyl transferase
VRLARAALATPAGRVAAATLATTLSLEAARGARRRRSAARARALAPAGAERAEVAELLVVVARWRR